ncbi:hypothetical protein V2J09_007769 [Rumex salicifolius]
MAGERKPYPPCVTGFCSTRSCCAAGERYEWPELVGAEAEKAKTVIENTNKFVTVVSIGQHGGGITNFCCNRVYLFLDANNRPPLRQISFQHN